MTPINTSNTTSGTPLQMGANWWTPSTPPRLYTPTLSAKPADQQKITRPPTADAASTDDNDFAHWQQTAPEGYSEWAKDSQ